MLFAPRTGKDPGKTPSRSGPMAHESPLLPKCLSAIGFIVYNEPNGVPAQRAPGTSRRKLMSEASHEMEITIYVNTRPKKVTKNEDISFEREIDLAYDGNPPSGPNVEFTV